MSPLTIMTQMRERRFPRVSGDEPAVSETVDRVAEFSPRERG